MRRPFLALLACIALNSNLAWAQKFSQYDPNVVGLYRLPAVDKARLPDSCRDFTAACAAERKGDLETAFKLYEDKYDTCGDVGWEDFGHKHGASDSVTFKVTPCGLKTAVKGLLIPKECNRLRQLTTGDAARECPGCFPQYFYYSNKTRACYSEFLTAVPLERILSQKHAVHTAGIRAIKVVFMQAMAAVKVMRS